MDKVEKNSFFATVTLKERSQHRAARISDRLLWFCFLSFLNVSPQSHKVYHTHLYMWVCVCVCTWNAWRSCCAEWRIPPQHLLFLILSGAPGISYDKGRQRLLAYYKEKGEYNAVSRLLVVDDDDGGGGGGIQLKSMSQRRAQVRGQGRTLSTVLTLRVSGVKSESTTRGQGGEFTMYLINMSAAVWGLHKVNVSLDNPMSLGLTSRSSLEVSVKRKGAVTSVLGK